MTTVFAAASIALTVTLGLVLIRAVRGPTVFDRLLAANAIGTKTVLLLALLGFMQGRPEFLDMALIYALINFVTTLAFLRLVEHGRLS